MQDSHEPLQSIGLPLAKIADPHQRQRHKVVRLLPIRFKSSRISASVGHSKPLLPTPKDLPQDDFSQVTGRVGHDGTCLVKTVAIKDSLNALHCSVSRNDLRGLASSRLCSPLVDERCMLQAMDLFTSSPTVQDAIGSFATLLFSFISSQQAQAVLGFGSRSSHRSSIHRPDEYQSLTNSP